ncbi:MAG: hypothetical protein U0Q18_14880 [Bryobacteraceae bacterium]
MIRRIGRLERQLTPNIDTAFGSWLVERMEQGRRRLQEAQDKGECDGPIGIALPVHNGKAPRSLIDILHAGRERARLLAIREQECQQDAFR